MGQEILGTFIIIVSMLASLVICVVAVKADMNEVKQPSPEIKEQIYQANYIYVQWCHDNKYDPKSLTTQLMYQDKFIQPDYVDRS